MTFGVVEYAGLAVFFSSLVRGGGDGASDPSSILLKLHRQYQYTPHDMALYDTLDVQSNATMTDITKSYRRLCRDYHPDKRRLFLKQRKRSREKKSENSRGMMANDEKAMDYFTVEEKTSTGSEEEDEDPDFLLEKVRQAYEVLKDDITRLPYHKFGLIDTSTAALLLTRGSFECGGTLSWEQRRLLQLMGYPSTSSNDELRQLNSNDGRDNPYKERVHAIATNLIETIRPLVEDVVSQDDFCQSISTECDFLKNLPLGSHILRCIGRAYRHTGQRALRRYHRSRKLSKQNLSSLRQPIQVGLNLSDDIRDALRNARQVATAAVASGKLILTEKRNSNAIKAVNKKAWEGGLSATCSHYSEQLNQQQRDEQECEMAQVDRMFSTSSIQGADFLDNQLNEIDTEDDIYELGHLSVPRTQNHPESLSPGADINAESSEILRQKEQAKAKQAVLRTLEVDALWKIYKIELDRSVREACSLILNSEYAFFPAKWRNEQWRTLHSNKYHEYGPSLDGWVSPYNAQVISAKVGRIRAAAALVMVGDIMVRCSKEKTSWRNKNQ